MEAVEHIVEDAGQHNVSLDGLAICLGPDLRAMYPLVMNFGVEGELGVSGPAHPDQVGRQGDILTGIISIACVACSSGQRRCKPPSPAHPTSPIAALHPPTTLRQVRVRGTLRLPSGDVNLVATQLALDREHANLITFQAEQGLDPVVDLVMTGGDLRVAIQVWAA